MNVDGLTRDNVASHLQKHRMHLKKCKGEGKPPARTVSRSLAAAEAATSGARAEVVAVTTSPANEGEATTVPTAVLVGKSGGNFESGAHECRGQGEYSGEGTSGSGSGNSTSRHVTVSTTHSHSGSRRGADASAGAHTLASHGNTGCSNGTSAGGARSSQTAADEQLRGVRQGQTRGSQTRETNAVVESNGMCGQSACEPAHGT